MRGFVDHVMLLTTFNIYFRYFVQHIYSINRAYIYIILIMWCWCFVQCICFVSGQLVFVILQMDFAKCISYYIMSYNIYIYMWIVEQYNEWCDNNKPVNEQHPHNTHMLFVVCIVLEILICIGNAVIKM